MEGKLFDSELKVMDVLWREGDCTAKHISDVLKEEVGWNMNTTYTLIKRCIKKGAIQRSEPNFLCHALVEKAEVQEAETNELITRSTTVLQISFSPRFLAEKSCPRTRYPV